MSLICLSRPEGRVAGLKQVFRFLRQGLLEKVFIAKDADEEIAGKLKQACEKYGIPYDMEYTMHQIGSACAGVVKNQ